MRAMTYLLSVLAVGSVAACHGRAPLTTGSEPDPAYEAAVAASAIRHSSWEVRLRALPDTDMVTVGSFTQYTMLDTQQHDVWVSSPDELREKCQGRRDAALALQQILGLPPRRPLPGNAWHVVVFEVAARSVFRPCPGDPRLQAEVCPVADTLGEMDDDTARFLLRQFWSSRHASSDGNYGVPFTGMGWTYNWDPRSADHVGVSEFVLRRGARPVNLRTLTPQEFCSANPALTRAQWE